MKFSVILKKKALPSDLLTKKPPNKLGRMRIDKMLTVKDINTKRFDSSKVGYDPTEVDTFLRDVSASFKQIMSEKEELENKMTVLAESIREFRRQEEDLKNAMLDVQRTKRTALEQAKDESKKIMADAHEQAKSIIGNTTAKLNAEKAAFEKLQTEVSDFKAQLLSLYRDHLAMIQAIPAEEEEETETETESAELQQEMAQSEAEESVIAPEEFEEIAEETAASDPFGSTPKTNSGKFSGLRFGQNV
jgi:cell division initiation protein